MNVFDLISAPEIAAYWKENLTLRTPFLGEGLFPSRKQVGLDLSWIRGYKDVGVILRPSAFDARPTLRDRGGISKQQTSLPFFREAMHLNERDRQQLLSLSSADDALAAASVARLFEDAAGLVESARIVPEVMRWGVLQDAGFTITSDAENVTYEYSYDPDNSWHTNNVTTLSGTDTWDNEDTARPVRDILAIKRAALAQGVRLTRAIIGPELWAFLLENQHIITAFAPGYPAGTVDMGDDELASFLSRKLGITFTLYEKQYKDADGNNQTYLNSDKVVLLPSDNIGETVFGTTPEEADLRSGLTDASVQIVNTGVALCTKVEAGPPVQHVTWASEVVLPTAENLDAVYVLKAVPTN